MEEQFVTLSKIAGGAIGEAFQESFGELIDNIVDVNTDPQAKRSLTIRLELKPTDQRNFATYKLFVETRLAKPEPIVGSFRIGRLGGKVEATEIVEPPSPILTAISNLENHNV